MISVRNSGGSCNVDTGWLSEMGETSSRVSRNVSTFSMRHIVSVWPAEYLTGKIHCWRSRR